MIDKRHMKKNLLENLKNRSDETQDLKKQENLVHETDIKVS